ncbi:MAG: tyrosine-type recombinase/integrase [Pirellulales bacterium]
MANLYRPTYTKTDPETGERVTGRLRKWYAKYRDADGVIRKVPLCADKTAAQAMLASILRNADRQHAGLVDPTKVHLTRAIDDHIDDFRTHLLAMARSPFHISETVRNIQAMVAACGGKVLGDLKDAGSRMEQRLADRLGEGKSYRTINAVLIAVRSFCKWLTLHKRLPTDPTQGLKRLNVEEDRRRTRRSLTDDESRRLIQAATESQRVERGLSGVDRAMLYLLAQRTGLRRSELKSLRHQSFKLEASPPSVAVKARQSKHRENDLLPLPAEVAEALRDYLKGRDPAQPIWPGGWWRRSAEMFQADLKEANIACQDEEGTVLDFHGQRTTFITGLALAGVPPATAQRLARHSDVNLTMGTYTRLQIEELAGAVDKLPGLRSPHQTDVSESRQLIAESRPTAEIDDHELQHVVAAWQSLAQEVRATILSIVRLADAARPKG